MKRPTEKQLELMRRMRDGATLIVPKTGRTVYTLDGEPVNYWTVYGAVVRGLITWQGWGKRGESVFCVSSKGLDVIGWTPALAAVRGDGEGAS